MLLLGYEDRESGSLTYNRISSDDVVVILDGDRLFRVVPSYVKAHYEKVTKPTTDRRKFLESAITEKRTAYQEWQDEHNVQVINANERWEAYQRTKACQKLIRETAADLARTKLNQFGLSVLTKTQLSAITEEAQKRVEREFRQGEASPYDVNPYKSELNSLLKELSNLPNDWTVSQWIDGHYSEYDEQLWNPYRMTMLSHRHINDLPEVEQVKSKGTLEIYKMIVNGRTEQDASSINRYAMKTLHPACKVSCVENAGHMEFLGDVTLEEFIRQADKHESGLDEEIR